MLSLFINWDVNPEIFNLGGISIRYYGLFITAAFLLGYKVTEKIFKSEGISLKSLDALCIYVAVGLVVGARIGHCIFYEWDYYYHHMIEIILPVRFVPNFHFIGYQGLASHGAGIGFLIALFFYSKKVSKKSVLWILDRAVISVALAAFFIRMGNLMNSEIIGQPTTLFWGFSFVNSGMENPELPRHPAQLYEAICYFVSFFILMHLYWRTNLKKRMGFITGSFLMLIFGSRFLIEFTKEVQEPWEMGMVLNMGQILSIPFIIVAACMLWYSKKLPDVETDVLIEK